MKDIELGWVAGIIEGEGSFSLDNRQGYNYPIIQVSMSDEDTINRLLEVTNIGTVCFSHPASQAIRGDKPLWKWKVSKQQDTIALMNLIFPLMSQRRQHRITEVLNAWENTPRRVVVCGTRSGYQKHWRNGEKACEPCLIACRKGK